METGSSDGKPYPIIPYETGYVPSRMDTRWPAAHTALWHGGATEWLHGSTTGGRMARRMVSVPWRPTVVAGDLYAGVRSGVVATLIACLGVIGFTTYALGPMGHSTDIVVGLVVLAVVGAAAVHAFSRDEVRLRRWAGPMFMIWSSADALVIGGVMVVTGGWESPLVWLLVLPVTFFTVLMDARSAGLMFALVVSIPFIAGVIAGTPPPPERAIILLSVLAANGMLTTWLSTALRDHVAEARTAAAAAQRRSQLLAVTGQAARSLGDVDVGAVATNIVEATASLGFGAVLLYDVDAGSEGGLTCRAQVGLDASWVGRSLASGEGLASEVAERGEVVTVTDYGAADRALPELRDAGFRAALAVPVKDGDVVAAVLAAGTRREQPLLDEDVEAIETLAIHAGVALRMARAFEAEGDARRHLEELVELHHDHVSTLAHELRTPLTVILGAGHLLRDRWDRLPAEDRRSLVERLAFHSRDLVRLIDRLGHLEELRRGTKPIRPRPVTIETVVSTLTHTFSERCEDYLLTSRAPRGVRAHADPSLLELVLIELIDNAIRHTPEGTHVHVEVELEEDRVEIAVVDDGPGIPEADLSAIGAAFRRAGHVNTRPARGLGIGLSIVRHVLDAHETSLEVRSGPEGTRSSFSLDLVDVDETKPTQHVLLLGDLIPPRRPVGADTRGG